MEQLEIIKEKLAKEKGFEDYSELLLQSTHSFGDLDSVINEIVNTYIKKVVIDAYNSGYTNCEDGMTYSAEDYYQDSFPENKL